MSADYVLSAFHSRRHGMSAPAHLSVYVGREYLGRTIDGGSAKCSAFTAEYKSLGTFSHQRAAAEAITRRFLGVERPA
jgi:hypothetical protein